MGTDLKMREGLNLTYCCTKLFSRIDRKGEYASGPPADTERLFCQEQKVPVKALLRDSDEKWTLYAVPGRFRRKGDKRI